MRILLTGANGQVGWELARSLMPLGEVIAPGRADCELALPQTLGALVAGLGPDVIVNAAA
jgi:dTDP-4-dehydrorhamnose reductase